MARIAARLASVSPSCPIRNTRMVGTVNQKRSERSRRFGQRLHHTIGFLVSKLRAERQREHFACESLGDGEGIRAATKGRERFLLVNGNWIVNPDADVSILQLLDDAVA